MNKIQKVIIALGLAGAVGLTYLITSLKGIPDVFEWDDTDE